MAERKSKSRSNGRGSSDYDDYAIVDPKKIEDGPDVLVDVPVVKVDEIDLEVEDLRAQVAVLAEVQQLVQISVGADVRLGEVKLNIQGVEAQALLKARLNNVSAILQRVLLSLDRNPELLQSVGRAVEDVGSGAGKAVGKTGEAAEEIGEGAGQATKQIGQGAGKAAQGVGKGAKQGTSQLAQGGKG